ncbi:MAG TPA: RNA polymerase sigma factor [Bryobacteraceae bacterium]|nr:RNA polymerase sigma factor [Bryobacteraceae bacterium]
MPLPFTANLSENPTDAELMQACKRGNRHAYERLYELHAGRLKSIAFHLVGSRADAEDAVQETFLKVYRAMDGFEGQSSLSTWMCRILINCCYDVLRKQQKLAEQPVRGDVASESKLPLKVALERALGRLNERQRIVFLLFEVEGLRHSEIAAVLQVPEGTSRNWLFEAKRELKRSLMEKGA